MKLLKESDIQKAILEYLQAKGIYAWRNNSVGIYDPTRGVYRKNVTKKGVSDIIGIMPDGRFLAIEVKGPKGKLTSEQKTFLFEIRRFGGVAFMARSVHDVTTSLAFWPVMGMFPEGA